MANVESATNGDSPAQDGRNGAAATNAFCGSYGSDRYSDGLIASSLALPKSIV